MKKSSGRKTPWRKLIKRSLRFELIRAAVACVSALPLSWASALGARAGLCAWALASRERQRTLNSLEVAFPDLRTGERQALGSACFAHLGRSAFELACYRQLDNSIVTLAEWPDESRAVLDRALARNKGVVFVTGHVGHWELLARRIALAGYPCQTIAKETTDNRLTHLIEKMRSSARLKTIWRGRPGAAKAMLGALRRGEILGILIDQDTKVQSVYVPFFGRAAKTPRAAADLALRADAAVVLGFCHRVGPMSFRISMRELETPQTRSEATVQALTSRMTQGIEEAIRSAPEQWVWMHRRWRSRPEPAAVINGIATGCQALSAGLDSA